MSEYLSVERPFLQSLAGLGWEIMDQGEGIPSDPTKSLRTSFSEVALRQVFRDRVRDLNRLPDGRTWLTDAQLDGLLGELTDRHHHPGLLEANEAVHDLLRGSRHLRRSCALQDGDELPVTLIDLRDPERNHFLAVNQFRVDPPGGGEPIRPDVVLFVNGLPLVVVECKDLDPNTSRPVQEAVEDLRVYANRRAEQGGIYDEGDERLFVTNLFVVATCGADARAGTITGSITHFYSWRDVTLPSEVPATARVAPPLPEGVEVEREQERLVRGMLHRHVLLDLLRHFTVFMDAGKRRIKVLARYQQYRAVEGILERLRRTGEPIERSGVVWHTQGSGKSLTMVFAIRKLRTRDDLKDHRVLLVNDRKDLERQLKETARLTGEKPKVIQRIGDLEALRQHASDVVLVMVHKFQEERTTGVLDGLLAADGPPPAYGDDDPSEPAITFPTLHDSSRIVVMVDEAHRTQAPTGGRERSSLGDNLVAAFPNAARIAFTGTPLVTSRYERKGTRTIDRFGGYIDKYRFDEAIADRATTRIAYIGRTVNVELKAGATLDQALLDEARRRTAAELANQGKAFPDLVAATSDAAIARIKKLYGEATDVFEADARIADIAKEIVDHYVAEILPNGFKAQVVCSSQLAAARYKRHLDAALDAKRAALADGDGPSDQLRARLAMLRTAVVLSDADKRTLKEVKAARKATREAIGSVKDCVDWYKADFDPAKPKSGLGLLIVCDMLLTGFDAPIEQVMYLDKRLKEHTLLQTVARVNRVRSGKDCGYVVDFVGLLGHLDKAFEIYGDASEDLEGVVENLEVELGRLEEHRAQLLAFFESRDHDSIHAFVDGALSEAEHRAALDQAVALLRDAKVRAEFEVLFEDFLRSLNVCYALQSARAHVPAAQRFGEIQRAARDVYRDRSLDVRWAAAKVRELVNRHLASKGVDPAAAPLPLTDPAFLAKLRQRRSARNAAAEMEHALRVQIKLNLMKDPGLYKEISEKLEQILKRHREDWVALQKRAAEASKPPPTEEEHWLALLENLEPLREDVTDPTAAEVEGLTAVEAAFWRVFVDVVRGDALPEQAAGAKALIAELVALMRQDMRLTGFRQHPDAVRDLRSKLRMRLLATGDAAILAARDAVIDAFVQLAQVRNDELVTLGA